MSVGDLKKSLKSIAKECSALALPCNKNHRNGGGFPLWAWLRSAPADSISPINDVIDGKARYRYKRYADAIDIAVDRVSRRFDITDSQRYLLAEYFSIKYRGKTKILPPHSDRKSVV